eukprot:Protomagalhaensia_wolfi_Nauph_80__1122@NODE_165_length_3359_cov_142_432831_g124_i0_p4_GENE_NODE_165_length_3359_cov_142_432831_g124_i0NODE_165_length_3359_cov_142_432831_g124_i0_p4_ORF_typecomplete_len118_score1_51_NODE_165_length_3359_cov_142_432831_g124_i0133486
MNLVSLLGTLALAVPESSNMLSNHGVGQSLLKLQSLVAVTDDQGVESTSLGLDLKLSDDFVGLFLFKNLNHPLRFLALALLRHQQLNELLNILALLRHGQLSSGNSALRKGRGRIFF